MPDQVEQRLREIEERVSKATPGPYNPIWEMCDCGGDYPCGHPDYVWGLALPEPRAWTKGEHGYDFNYSEICEFPPETVLMMAHSRDDIPFLLALLREREEENHRLRERLTRMENRIRTLIEEEYSHDAGAGAGAEGHR